MGALIPLSSLWRSGSTQVQELTTADMSSTTAERTLSHHSEGWDGEDGEWKMQVTNQHTSRRLRELSLRVNCKNLSSEIEVEQNATLTQKTDCKGASARRRNDGTRLVAGSARFSIDNACVFFRAGSVNHGWALSTELWKELILS